MKLMPAFRNRQVIANCVMPYAGSQEEALAIGATLALAKHAWKGYKIPKHVSGRLIAFRQNEAGAPVFEDGVLVWPFPLEGFDDCIQNVERGRKKMPRLSRVERQLCSTDGTSIILSIGSLAYCQAATHYFALNPKQRLLKPWGAHMLRELSASSIDATVWYDSQDRKIHRASTRELLLDLTAGWAKQKTRKAKAA